MIRIEIYAHESLEKPLLEALVPVPPGTHDQEGTSGRPYSMIRGVAGRGTSGTSMGDDIWPETNILLVLFVEDKEHEEILDSISQLRLMYPKLGLAVFTLGGYEEVGVSSLG